MQTQCLLWNHKERVTGEMDNELVRRNAYMNPLAQVVQGETASASVI